MLSSLLQALLKPSYTTKSVIERATFQIPLYKASTPWPSAASSMDWSTGTWQKRSLLALQLSLNQTQMRKRHRTSETKVQCTPTLARSNCQSLLSSCDIKLRMGECRVLDT